MTALAVIVIGAVLYELIRRDARRVTEEATARRFTGNNKPGQ